MKKKEEEVLNSLDTFEIHEKMFEERIKELKEDDYMAFEELIRSANTSILIMM